MGYLLFIILITLIISLFLSKVKLGWAKIFRAVILVFSISLFTYWFIKKSSIGVVQNAVALQLINKLPQPLDFYVLNVKNSKNDAFEVMHLGKIRPEYYRVEYLKMAHSDEYWIIGYLGKKNAVYFSQHSVPNKNIDQMIEVQNYINQSVKLSGIAKKEIEVYNQENTKLGVLITLNLLLLFLNLSLFIRKK
jgi:energy-coupling factor transporter transmembrane protein EcfT